MKKKNGFTLIEILAVVVVLAIVTLISVPIIINISSSVRKSALETSVKGLIESANIYFVQHENDIKDPIEFVITNGKQEGTKKLDYNGRVENAYLMLFNDNKKAVCADDGKYAASKGINDKKITVVEGNCMGYDEAYKGYVVGDANGFTSLNIKAITDESQLGTGKQNYIRVVTETPITGFYVSATPPVTPSQGMVWIVQANNSPYYLQSEEVRIGVSYVMQYENNKWNLKYAYVYNKDEWKLLYYVDMTDGNLNLENSNLGDIQVVNTFEYTGEYQEFTAVFSGYYNIQAWGAQGGHVSAGGKGAYTSGEVYLDAGETIYIYVGGTTTSSLGGWNGGGNGYGGSSWIGYGGGGATDIRLVKTSSKQNWDEFDSLKSRIMVAAGGGGSQSNTSHVGGAGGELIGISGKSHYGNGYFTIGGTQSSSGYALNNENSSLGGFGYGGNSSKSHHTQGGGGGGYYGGGGAAYYYTGGGGGSSYISGYDGCSSINENSTKNNIIHNGSKYHYSNHYFLNADIKNGTSTSIPSHDNSSLINGNSGNGYAIISLKTVEFKGEEKLKKEINDDSKEWNYTYSATTVNTGRYQTFIAPKSGYYNIQLWGAQGGHTSAGGKGAYTSGEIYLEENETIYVYVGGTSLSSSAGWNGGGDGYNGNEWIGYGGGGATDIRLTNTSSLITWNEFDSLKSRIMVAAGGGGSQSNTSHVGGAGGELIGISGKSHYGESYGVTGGTQSLGGYATNNQTSSIGGFGYGGTASKSHHTQGGGGGGYYGGGGAAYHYTGGGGGSSYISGYDGCSSISSASTESNIIHTGIKYHYSDYYFKNSVMKSGIDQTVPTHDGAAAITGNSGNGYAKIVLKSAKTEDKDTLKKQILDNSTEWNYSYSGTTVNIGRYQTFVAPKSGYYTIHLWGAQGGHTSYGGKGAYTSGDIYLNENELIYLYVGGTTLSTIRGWNGGGEGHSGYSEYAGYGGGGSTDIRLVNTSSLISWNEFNSLKSRIMIAAGGGGGHTQSSTGGGAGGGLIGNSSNSSSGTGYFATGGTQSSGGYAQNNYITAIGGFGYGSASSKTNHTQGGGGSGYYGGGGAGYHYTGGGGGSSYISGYAGCSSIDKESTETNIIHNGSRFHYSGYYFKDAIIKSGDDSSMPTYDGSSNMTGNSGNGYAKIILKSETRKTKDELNEKMIEQLNEWEYIYSGTSIYDGRYQKFTAPKPGYYKVQLWGAQGGHTSYGGRGSYTAGDIYLNAKESIYVYVGGTTISSLGGWNGGGAGNCGYSEYTGYGGGGSTDIRTVKTNVLSTWNELNSLKTRIMVAAGGGGGHTQSSTGGGAGGGLIGNSSNSTYGTGYFATGGTQIGGGYALNNTSSSVGDFGVGADASKSHHTQGAGGSGWYGGGGAAYHYTGGGGGSSYISGHAGCIAITSSVIPKVQNYSTLSDSVSYTGYKFTNTQIIDGAGYPWTTVKSTSSSGMPSPVGLTNQTGNTGNGYAKITYLGE